jgi:hypothetical protein
VNWFFGAGATPTFEFSGTIITPGVNVGSTGFTTSASAVDIVNEAVAVPEPGSLTELLFMVATTMTLTVAGVFGRRKSRISRADWNG